MRWINKSISTKIIITWLPTGNYNYKATNSTKSRSIRQVIDLLFIVYTLKKPSSTNRINKISA